MLDLSVVILTMGDRPDALARAVASVRRQRGIDVEVVLVVNGGRPQTSLADTVVEPDTNLGVPGGRTRGAEAAEAPLILFLDDDAAVIGDDALAIGVRRFTDEPDLGVLGLRIVDDTGATDRRYLAGIRKDPERGRDTTSFPGGAVLVRASTFAEVGGLFAAYRYALEETDFAWRTIDAGHRVAYEPRIQVLHPRTSPTRHPNALQLTARNRVWLARRLLPWPLVLLYPSSWFVITVARNATSWSAVRATAAGTLEGIRSPVERRPMSWSTVVRLCRLGRPPIV